MVLKRLSLPCPPAFERVMGYWGQARYVGFYWDLDSPVVGYTDGRLMGDGDWSYLLWLGHPQVLGVLLRAEVLPLTERLLVLDRYKREWWVGLRAEAKQWLEWQNPQSVMPLSAQEWEALLEQLRQALSAKAVRCPVWEEQYEQRLQQERDRMLVWLDQYQPVQQEVANV